MRAGKRRNHFQDIGDPTKPQTFDPAQAYDLSKGQPVKLPAVTYPRTLDEAAGSAPKFESDWNMRNAQSQQLLGQTLTLVPGIANKSSLTIIRTTQILSLSANVRATPPLTQLYNPWFADLKHALDLTNNWRTSFGTANADCTSRFQLAVAQIDCLRKWCSAAEPTAQRGWYDAIKQTDTALRAWADAYSRFASGLATNLKDPTAHQWAVVDEQYWLMSNYALLIEYAWVWTSGVAGDKGTCFDQQTDSPAETSDSGTASAPECSDLIGGSAFNLNLELISINVSCESFGISSEEPYLEAGFAEAGIFASASYAFKDGSTTVFAGAYAKVAIGGLSTESKAGLYATFDQPGIVEDVGMRALSALDNSSGPVSSSVEGPPSSRSFVGTAAAGEG